MSLLHHKSSAGPLPTPPPSPPTRVTLGRCALAIVDAGPTALVLALSAHALVWAMRPVLGQGCPVLLPSRTESCGLRATTGKHTSSAKQNPHQWYQRRLSVWKKMCNRTPPPPACPLQAICIAQPQWYGLMPSASA